MFTKNRDRVVEADVGSKFLAHEKLLGLASDEHKSKAGPQ